MARAEAPSKITLTGEPSREFARDIPRLRSILALLLLLVDVAMIGLAFWLGYILRRELPIFAAPIDPPPLRSYLPMLAIQLATLIGVFYFARMYHQRRATSRIDTFYAIAASVSVGVVMANGIAGILLKGTGVGADYPRQMILYVWILTIILVLLGRELHRLFVARMRRLGLGRDRALIVGSGDVAVRIVQHIDANPQLGYRVVGAVNGDEVREVGGVPVVGGPDQLSDLIDTLQIDEVIIAMPNAPRADLVQLVSRSQRGRVSIKIYPDLFSYMAGGMSVDDLGGMPLLNVRDVALRGWKLSLKRGLDIFGAFFGLIALSPFMLLTAILIRLESPGAIFFCQERMGLDGRPFPMIKFRSMRADAENKGRWTVKGDPRVTRIGKWMRKTNWDEIPNLINVLLGHMSLVGPRPEQVYWVEQFRDKIPRYMERHREKAGMTGWAQVNGLRGDTSIEERIKYDLWYVENWSFWLDIKILIRTVVQTVTGKSPNAY